MEDEAVCRSTEKIQLLYLNEPRASCSDDELMDWYQRAEAFAADQKQRFFEEAEKRIDSGDAETPREFGLAWQDIERHFWKVDSDGSQENIDFWLMLRYKAVSLRNYIRLIYCDDDEEDA